MSLEKIIQYVPVIGLASKEQIKNAEQDRTLGGAGRLLAWYAYQVFSSVAVSYGLLRIL